MTGGIKKNKKFNLNSTENIMLLASKKVVTKAQSGRETRNAKKPLKGFQGCDKNGLNESFKMSPHLICLS